MTAAAPGLARSRAIAAPGAVRAFERALFVYRRTWRGTLFLSFFSPILYLVAMGLGLGGYIDETAAAELPGGSYLAFLGPGLMAAQAMNVGTFESTYPLLGAIVWNRTFDAMLATPLRVRDLLAAHLLFVSFRTLITTVAFLGAMLLFGGIDSPGILLALPAAVLTGLAFAAPVAAFAATLKTDNGFASLFRFVITPLFIFSGTFFPVEQLPGALQPIAWLTPLYHGVELARGLALGTADPIGGLVHAAVLSGYAGVGAIAAGILLRRRLIDSR